MGKQQIVDLSHLSGTSFEVLCCDILNLLEPIKIVRYEGGHDSGRDLEVLLPLLEVSSENEQGQQELWWVECKERGIKHGRGLGLRDISTNVVAALAQSHASPDVLAYMTTTHITAPAKQMLQQIKTNFRITYLEHDDIQTILLANPTLIERHFPPEVFESSEGHFGNGNKTRKVFLNAYRAFDYKSRKLRLRAGRPVTMEIEVVNLSPKLWNDVFIEVSLPSGLCIQGDLPSGIKLRPYERKTFKINLTLDRKIIDSTNIDVLISDSAGLGCDITHSYDEINFQPTLHFAFVGRDTELSRIVQQGKTGAGIVLIEGLTGEGKSRLIEESEFLLAAAGLRVARVGHNSLTSSAAFFISVTECLLDIPLMRRSPSILGAYLRYHLPGINSDQVDLLVDSLIGKVTLSRGHAERVVEALADAMQFSDNSPTILVLDDFHRITPSVMQICELLLRVFREFCVFIIGYRDNEISEHVRNRLLALSTDVVQLAELNSDAMYKILDSTVALPDKARSSLIDLSAGNPYCLAECLRLLLESKSIQFRSDGLLEETSEEAYHEFKWPKDQSQTHENYTQAVALRRYRRFIDNQKPEDTEQIGDVIAFVAAADITIPISVIEGAFGNVIDLVDELIDEQICSIRTDFANEPGVALIHDQMGEALRQYMSHRALYWSSINQRVADVLVLHLDHSLLAENYERIAGHYALGGNQQKELEYLTKYFHRCADMEQYLDAADAGQRCLKLLNDLPECAATDISKTARIHFDLGLTYYRQRRFDEMESELDRVAALSPTKAGLPIILKLYRTVGKLKRNPREAEHFFTILEETVNALEELDSDDADIRDALLEGLSQYALFQKKFRADYTSARQAIHKSLRICQRNYLKKALLRDLINEGTMILFADEQHRDRLAFEAMPAIWSETLDHWLGVLEQAEEERFMEPVIETNCAVGFMKMLLGFHRQDTNLSEEAFLHFKRARLLADRYGHDYWRCKLHNHFGVYAVLGGDLDKAEIELQRGILLAENIKNHYTIWFLYQNLANLAAQRDQYTAADKYWRTAFKFALDHYFENHEVAIRSYNFRQLIRGFIMYETHNPRSTITTPHESWSRLIANDDWLKLFRTCCREKEPGFIETRDLYAFSGSYYNVH